MSFTYVLTTVITVSLIIVHEIKTQPLEITFGHVNGESKSENSLELMELGNRESNIRYVMAIKNSIFWTEIKRRSLTISTEPQANSIIDKSPSNLSNEELMLLKQVCQDGLKCVAVDHLLILTKVMQLTDGKKSVRTVITKITKVLSKYTSEYNEKTYQYEEVTDKDDTDKVYSSVTTILEDNEELCQIDSNIYSRSVVSSYLNTNSDAYLASYEGANENSNKSSDSSLDKTSGGSLNKTSSGSLNKTSDGSLNKISDSSSNKNSDSSSNRNSDSSSNKNSDSSSNKTSDGNSDGSLDSSDEKDGPLMIINNGHINFGNVNTYNINEGTLNSATLNLGAPTNSDGGNKKPTTVEIGVELESSTPASDNTSTSQNNDQNKSISQNKGTKNVDVSDAYNDSSNRGTQNSVAETAVNPNQGISGNSYPETVETVVPADIRIIQIKSIKDLMAEKPNHVEQTDTNGGSTDPNVSNNVDGSSSPTSNKSNDYKNITDGSADNNAHDSLNDDKTKYNIVRLCNAKNATQCKNNQTNGIVCAGHHNNGKINNGATENGNLNNGIMSTTDTNKGVNNKGNISNADSKNGIINVGTVNNGMTNYANLNHRINYGTINSTKNFDVQQYVNNLNNMYSSMLNDLAK